MDTSVMRSGMMRSGISRIAIQSPPSKGAVCMKYCVLLLVLLISMFLIGIAVYFAFLQKANNEQPPLICSLDGLERSLRIPELLCSHLVFLSAIVVPGSKAKPVDGAESGFEKFKNLKRTYGTVTKLLSFELAVINSLSMDVVNNAFLSIAGGTIDGLDIRYFSGSEPSLHLIKDLRKLADSEQYIIHGVFDSVKINVMKDFHIASLRVYRHPTPPGPFKAVSLQPTADIESGVQAYQAAVQGAKLAASGNHCIALSLAAVQYSGAHSYGDDASDFAKAAYCSDDYDRKDAVKSSSSLSHYVRNDKMNALFVFEEPEDFKSKVTRIGKLPNACLLLDDIFYDRHTCTCDDTNFKLLKTARKVLWQSLRG
ncbi:uncharacterized protein [Dermacentor albipictus]|uniref:uncharacterized protein isoform X2 n=1 Tax=Dermacentor albipictus TaxID=60249 RepID=UPI0031FCC75D